VILHLLHRSVALFAVFALVAFAIHAWKDWAKIPGARPLAGIIIGLLVATATLGIFSALLKAPANLQDLHLAGAAAVLAVSVTLASLGWLTGADSTNE
jgi:heme A synthase